MSDKGDRVRKIILYIATSLDGYIAREKGEIDWLFSPDGNDYGYEKMFARIDTVIMGRATFDVSRKLEEKPFAGKRCIVFTRNKKLKNYSNVEYVTQNPVELVEKLQKEKGKDIWIVGGGEIASALLNRDLIDEYYFFVHPIILGKGISLYSHMQKQVTLSLVSAHAFANGLVELRYSKYALSPK